MCNRLLGVSSWLSCASEAASTLTMPAQYTGKGGQRCSRTGTGQSGGSDREEDDGHYDRHPG